MAIINTILSNVPIFIECFILWRLLSYVLKLKYSKDKAVLATIGLFIIMLLKSSHYYNVEGSQAVFSLLVMTYALVMIYLLTANSLIEKISWGGIYILGIALLEFVPLLLIGGLMDKSMENLLGGEISVFEAIVMKMITLLVFEAVFRRYKRKFTIGVSYILELSAVIILNIILILVMIFTFYNRHDIIKNNDIIILFFGVVTLITVFSVALIFRIEHKSNEEINTKLKLQQIELELKLNNDMIEVTDKLRKLRHDMNNHIGLIKTLVHTGKYEELKEYINQIYEDVEIANELVITNNRTLSVLLNAKKNLAKEKNIDFSSVITAPDFNMQSKDICSLLGNILDNAIEAAEKSGSKRYINLVIQRTEKGCIIQCENSVGVKPTIKKGRFLTNKENTSLHGIGIDNIKDIVAKYQGEIEFEYNEEAFNVHVVIPV